jgi:hypothetical protein
MSVAARSGPLLKWEQELSRLNDVDDAAQVSSSLDQIEGPKSPPCWASRTFDLLAVDHD